MMKPIQIVIGDAGVEVGTLVDIKHELDGMSGKATSLTVTSANTVVDVAKRAELYFENHHVPVSDRAGAKISDAAVRNLVKRTLSAFGRTEVPPEKDWRDPAAKAA
jgi:hypothetical protein